MKTVKRVTKKMEEGQLRHRRGFLFFPKTIIQKELKITRWLESAVWLEKWNYTYPSTASQLDAPSYALRDGKWTATKWLDIEETAFQVIRDLGQESVAEVFYDPLNQHYGTMKKDASP